MARQTERYHFPLYDPWASPDLTETGDHDRALNMVDAAIGDEHDERVSSDSELSKRIDTEIAERKDADNDLDGRIDDEAADRRAADVALGGRIDTEIAERRSADDKLGGRIDTAETEISENSADLTGIKGLTYGKEQQVFLEKDGDGHYSSPALIEIQHDIDDIEQVTIDAGEGAPTKEAKSGSMYVDVTDGSVYIAD